MEQPIIVIANGGLLPRCQRNPILFRAGRHQIIQDSLEGRGNSQIFSGQDVLFDKMAELVAVVPQFGRRGQAEIAGGGVLL